MATDRPSSSDEPSTKTESTHQSVMTAGLMWQGVRLARLNPNTVELSRHSGMDRRNPDCMDASSSDHPWSLGSGAPPVIPDRGRLCRNDEINLNSTALAGRCPKPRRPWSLGSGDPCRNDEVFHNLTVVTLRRGDPSRTLRVLISPERFKLHSHAGALIVIHKSHRVRNVDHGLSNPEGCQPKA